MTDYKENKLINENQQDSLDKRINNIKLKTKTCFGCQTVFEYSDSNILDGAKYEVRCPNCGAYIMCIKMELPKLQTER